MKKSKLLILFMVMCLSIVSIAAVTYGWFVSVKRTGSVYFKTGEVKYVMTNDSFNNNFIKKSYIVPGEELLSSDIYVINQSTISSNLRIKVIVEVNGTEYIVDDTYQYINAVFETGWVYKESCWYYNGTEGVIESTRVDTPINLIKKLNLNGNEFGTTIESKKVKITLHFQGKQSNYATWEDLGSITKNFES
jgi:hypothetical protein